MIRQDNSQGLGCHSFMQTSEKWGLRIFLSLLALLWLSLVAGTWANASDSDYPTHNSTDNSVVNGSDEEYNFNWLDPEKKIYVLQNRKYLKTGRPQLSIMAGPGFSNPYRVTYSLDTKMAYYFSEVWGFEFFYTLSSNTPNSTFTALAIDSPNALPQIREIRTQYGGMLMFVPWYAKINVFNKILHFDWYFGAGVGNIQTFVDTRQSTAAPSAYVEQDLPGLFLSTGHLFHLSESLLFRLDMTGAIYHAPISGTTGDSAWFSNFNFGLGIGLKI